jgi:hypothetical protein
LQRQYPASIARFIVPKGCSTMLFRSFTIPGFPLDPYPLHRQPFFIINRSERCFVYRYLMPPPALFLRTPAPAVPAGFPIDKHPLPLRLLIKCRM